MASFCPINLQKPGSVYTAAQTDDEETLVEDTCHKLNVNVGGSSTSGKSGSKRLESSKMPVKAKKYWSDHDEHYLRDGVQTHMSFDDIARHLGRSKIAVKKKWHEMKTRAELRQKSTTMNTPAVPNTPMPKGVHGSDTDDDSSGSSSDCDTCSRPNELDQGKQATVSSGHRRPILPKAKSVTVQALPSIKNKPQSILSSSQQGNPTGDLPTPSALQIANTGVLPSSSSPTSPLKRKRDTESMEQQTKRLKDENRQMLLRKQELERYQEAHAAFIAERDENARLKGELAAAEKKYKKIRAAF